MTCVGRVLCQRRFRLLRKPGFGCTFGECFKQLQRFLGPDLLQELDGSHGLKLLARRDAVNLLQQFYDALEEAGRPHDT